MEAHLIYQLMLVVFVADFALGWLCSALNLSYLRKPIPPLLDGIYDADKYSKSQSYQKTLGRSGLIQALFAPLLVFLLLYNGWFGDISAWIKNWGYPSSWNYLLFLGILYLGSDVLGIPYALYRHFHVEARFGFNRMTLKTFVLDKLKVWGLSLLIGGGILWVLLLMILKVGPFFWIYFWIFLSLFFIGINFFYTSLILPLFNKLVPLGKEELRDALEAFSKGVAFPLQNVFVMDGSKRSSKGNAFFSGFGKKKKVVFYDTLIEKHPVPQLTAIFAHEVGHYKKRHILINSVISILQSGFMLYLLSLLLFNVEVTVAMGGKAIGDYGLNLVAFAILFKPIGRILSVLTNMLSRHHEYEADRYAAENFSPTALIEGLKRLAQENLVHLTPHPFYAFMNYSHPPLFDRVGRILQLSPKLAEGVEGK